jgi:hypothetical protein
MSTVRIAVWVTTAGVAVKTMVSVTRRVSGGEEVVFGGRVTV